ncbi:MAG TPA: glycosyltransferase family 39 protein [Burkholderiaceae bacterium]|nr:glycosyltransferase family 39 protein [Burkholderiaceae bacterium]
MTTSISLPLTTALVSARDQRRVGFAVALLCVGQVLLWSVMAGLNYTSPEIDSAEQFVWAFSMENGYWKHPPMPSWIMHGLLQAFGPSVELPFVATQVCIVTALALTWRLGREFMSPARSLIAMALTSLVTYHNIGGDSFNHNTVLLPFQAATVLLFYLACRRQAWHLWMLVGAFAGLSMLVKYVALLPLAGLLVYFALDRSLHTRRACSGLLLAVAVLALVLLPHFLWLRATNFLPFRYAHGVTQELPGVLAALRSLADFGLTQVLRLLPFLIGLGLVLRAPAAPDAVLPAAPIAAADRLFVWVVTCAPLVITMGVGLVTETALQARWGTNGFLFAGLLVMTLLRRPDDPAMLRRCLQLVVAIQVLLCAGQTLTKTVVADHLERRTRANFPGATLAELARQTWAAHTDAPLRLVVSDIWLGGNIIANSPKRVAVLIDGHYYKSPWVRREAVERCGALILDDTTGDQAGHAEPDPAIDTLMARAEFTGTWTLPWAHPKLRADSPERGVVRWGIIRPHSAESCSLH